MDLGMELKWSSERVFTWVRADLDIDSQSHTCFTVFSAF